MLPCVASEPGHVPALLMPRPPCRSAWRAGRGPWATAASPAAPPRACWRGWGGRAGRRLAGAAAGRHACGPRRAGPRGVSRAGAGPHHTAHRAQPAAAAAAAERSGGAVGRGQATPGWRTSRGRRRWRRGRGSLFVAVVPGGRAARHGPGGGSRPAAGHQRRGGGGGRGGGPRAALWAAAAAAARARVRAGAPRRARGARQVRLATQLFGGALALYAALLSRPGASPPQALDLPVRAQGGARVPVPHGAHGAVCQHARVPAHGPGQDAHRCRRHGQPLPVRVRWRLECQPCPQRSSCGHQRHHGAQAYRRGRGSSLRRWFPHGKVVFIAPTKPLVVQQRDACCSIMGVSKVRARFACRGGRGVGGVAPDMTPRRCASASRPFAG